ncbi:hypothetical protein ACGFYQ_31465 [Streptomyces sp. NPDC048258]|uniref:hypothetical protein n=1 Tax=Streptomyces sp. NPDC048258 TaxID=3365527 RepID=UPI0037180C94
MRAKRTLVLLSPGLVASLALSPGIATQASASPAPAQAAVAAPSIHYHVGQPKPPPDPNSQEAYDRGYEVGASLGLDTAIQDRKKGRAGNPRLLSPYSYGKTRYENGRADGFIVAYNLHIKEKKPADPPLFPPIPQEEISPIPGERPANPPQEEEEEQPANPPQEQHEQQPANPPQEQHEEPQEE